MSPESGVTRLPIPPKFKMEEWYMLSLSGLTTGQMRELTIGYITHLRDIAKSEVEMYNKYLEVFSTLESGV
jgi:hypothetical protein